MSARYLGGIVSKDPLTLNPAAGNAANGVFTLNQYMQAVKNATWPGFDPYFNRTVLSLHGNGTNGDQNNTFLDSSTNNFTITRNGNTTQGTFSPFSLAAGEWSNYFDGSGDYLSVASNAAFSPGTGDFTIECWAYFTATTGEGTLFYIGATNGINLFLNISSNWGIARSGVAVDNNFGTPPTFNTWNHLAVSRSGSTIRAFINGTQVFSGTNTTNYAQGPALIGSSNGFGTVTGYISNFRFVKGTALYTSNFTPSTTPLTNITNTSLLTCQSNRFVDNSTNNFTITRNGDVRVTPFSPFAPSAAYSASVNGGSGYFDGTGDRLTFATGQTPLLLGNSDFTFEAWVYRLNTNTACIFQGQADLNTAAGSSYVFFVGSSTSDLYISSSGYVVTSPNPPVGEWAHVAYVRTGGTYSSYLNGARVGTRADLSTLSVNNGSTTYGPNIGGFGTGTNQLTGYIGSARLIKGSGGYDATQTSITIPTAPLTAITNTSLLCNFTNAGIFDNTGKNNLETVGNAQIDTTTKKYGTGSMEFDGTGDYLTNITAGDPASNFGSGNFTIEMFVYHNQLKNYSGLIGDPNTIAIYTYTSGTVGVNLLLGSGQAMASSSGVALTNTWQHYALVRNGTVTTLYVDGISRATYTSSGVMQLGQTGGFRIGSVNTWGDLNGFIDDLRITKGVARYTANFTPQTSQWQDQ